MPRAQARYLQQLEEAAASGAPAPPVQEVVDLVWSMAIGGHLRPHACRTVLDAAAAAGVDLRGKQMDAVNAHKLVQARPRRSGLGPLSHRGFLCAALPQARLLGRLPSPFLCPPGRTGLLLSCRAGRRGPAAPRRRSA